MVVVVKADGSCRRVVDLSHLNKYGVRETHHVQPPFIKVREISSNTWKSVTDAWIGFIQYYFDRKIIISQHFLLHGEGTSTKWHLKVIWQVEMLIRAGMMKS